MFIRPCTPDMVFTAMGQCEVQGKPGWVFPFSKSLIPVVPLRPADGELRSLLGGFCLGCQVCLLLSSQEQLSFLLEGSQLFCTEAAGAKMGGGGKMW